MTKSYNDSKDIAVYSKISLVMNKHNGESEHKMKLRFISYIIIVVLGAVILVAGGIYMISNHISSEKYWYVPASGFLLILVGGICISIYRRGKTMERATATTMGIIYGSWGGGDPTDLCWFKVRFTVDGKDYRILETTSINDTLELNKQLKHMVTVHYDPDHPRTAWAECPGHYHK